MKSWKTTTLGILTIIVAIATAGAEFLKTQSINWPALTLGITAGWGLVQAKDATATGLPPK